MPIDFIDIISHFRPIKKTPGAVSDIITKESIDWEQSFGFANGTRYPYPAWWDYDLVSKH